MSRVKLMRWCIWFFLGNVLLFWLIAINNLRSLSWINAIFLTAKNRLVLKTFAGLTYLSHLGFLAFLPCLLLVPFILLFPRQKKLLMVSSIIVATLAVLLLVMDTVAYQLYCFHLNGVIINLITRGVRENILGLSWLEYGAVLLLVIGVSSLEVIYGIILWRQVINKNRWLGYGKWLACCLIFLFLSCLFDARQ